MSGNENDESLEDPPDEMRKDRIFVRKQFVIGQNFSRETIIEKSGQN